MREPFPIRIWAFVKIHEEREPSCERRRNDEEIDADTACVFAQSSRPGISLLWDCDRRLSHGNGGCKGMKSPVYGFFEVNCPMEAGVFSHHALLSASANAMQFSVVDLGKMSDHIA